MTSPDETVPPATLTAINSNNVDNLVQLLTVIYLLHRSVQYSVCRCMVM